MALAGLFASPLWVVASQTAFRGVAHEAISLRECSIVFCGQLGIATLHYRLVLGRETDVVVKFLIERDEQIVELGECSEEERFLAEIAHWKLAVVLIEGSGVDELPDSRASRRFSVIDLYELYRPSEDWKYLLPTDDILRHYQLYDQIKVAGGPTVERFAVFFPRG